MTYARCKKLVELVTVVGDPYEAKRSYKHPMTACDLLSGDNPHVLDKLVSPTGTITETTETTKIVEEEVEEEVEVSEEEGQTEEKARGDS